MQSVSAAFTAEEKDSVRSIAHNLQVSWKKQSTLTNRVFTIGVSLIGGNDLIGTFAGAIGSPSNYKYFDESAYVTGLAWERGLNIPLGGVSKALAEASLDNTSGRFTPRYMGGNSELYTAILPRRPMIINAGFEVDGIDYVIPQFAGVLKSVPKINMRNRSVNLEAADYIDYFENKFLDRSVMFTAQRTDEVIGDAFAQLGMSTAQYDLDYGINIIPFGHFPAGTSYLHMLNQITQAENGHLYQDPSGIFRFENRQHWDSSPHTLVQKVVLTGQVLEADLPGEDHLINVVEVRSSPRAKQPRQLLFTLGSALRLEPNQNLELFVNFDDPVVSVETPFVTGNTEEDGSGSEISINISSIDVFAQAAKYRFSSSVGGYIVDMQIFGRPARVTNDIYVRVQDDSSVTAYEERKLEIKNDYIQDESWAATYGQMILNDFSTPENMVKLVIRAIPELELGDLVSWQGRYWRIYDIKSTLDPSVGFVQELTMLQRTITSYFRIGISTIGGSDRISP